jgi:hypothetical protein
MQYTNRGTRFLVTRQVHPRFAFMLPSKYMNDGNMLPPLANSSHREKTDAHRSGGGRGDDGRINLFRIFLQQFLLRQAKPSIRIIPQPGDRIRVGVRAPGGEGRQQRVQFTRLGDSLQFHPSR